MWGVVVAVGASAGNMLGLEFVVGIRTRGQVVRYEVGQGEEEGRCGVGSEYYMDCDWHKIHKGSGRMGPPEERRGRDLSAPMPLPAISAGCAWVTRPERKPLLAAGVAELVAAPDSPASVAGSAMLEGFSAGLRASCRSGEP